MKKAALAAAALVALLLLIAVARTVMIGHDGQTTIATTGFAAQGGDAIARDLAGAVRFQTISHGDGSAPDAEAFTGLAAYLAETYPAIHGATTRETVGGYSLLYRWPGTDKSKKPVGFIAHLDVVPIEAGTEDQWTRPPFSGDIYDGKVWGRGSLDDKGHLILILEAAEKLAAEGFQPSRDIYFLFGHDEEVGGDAGAAAIAETLKSRGVSFEWTLDEGSGVVDGLIKGIEKPVALISTAEKGSVTLRFTAEAEGGHSSAPQDDTAVSLAARAIVAVTDHPHPARIDANTVAFLHAIAPEFPFMRRLALANLWMTNHMVTTQLTKDPVTAASLRTTTAPTIISGGAKANILPQHTEAIVNYRIHPRDSVESVAKRAEKLIDDDRVRVEILDAQEPSPQSSITSEGYSDIAETIGEIFGPIPVAPFLTLQGTDSKHYVDIADDNYRFTPLIYENDDLRRIHGTDERVGIDNLARAAAWYEALMRKSAG